jgi:sporulation protein YlmC with PRC-barrel domain
MRASLRLGSWVRCADGRFGELSDVVVDPSGLRLAHLVVQPEGARGLARLVPARLMSVAGSRDGEVFLSCSSETVEQCEHVQEQAWLAPGEAPRARDGSAVGVEDVVAMPTYDAAGLDLSWTVPEAHVWVSYDRVPDGEAEIRRASRVTSSDGHDVGHVDGLVVDDDLTITDLVVRRGHLWNRRTVTIALSDVAELRSDRVVLRLTHEAPGLH